MTTELQEGDDCQCSKEPQAGDDCQCCRHLADSRIADGHFWHHPMADKLGIPWALLCKACHLSALRNGPVEMSSKTFGLKIFEPKPN